MDELPRVSPIGQDHRRQHSTFSPLFCSTVTSEVLVNNLVGSMVESQPGTVEVAFPNSGAAAMPGREQG